MFRTEIRLVSMAVGAVAGDALLQTHCSFAARTTKYEWQIQGKAKQTQIRTTHRGQVRFGVVVHYYCVRAVSQLWQHGVLQENTKQLRLQEQPQTRHRPE